MADVFSDEIRRLLGQVNNPGVMYEGWQNPQNKPEDKAGNGAYATPFDRQGGSAVAQDELETQARDILGKMLGQQGYGREAVDELLQILKGTTQSPADGGNGRPKAGVEYGSDLSAGVQKALESDPNWQKFQSFMSAKEADDKKKLEDAKAKEDKDKEDKAMSAFAENIVNVIKTQVPVMIDEALSARGFVKPADATASAPVAAANGEAVPAGLSAQGAPSGVSYAGLGGVQLPPGMQVPSNNAAMSASENPNQVIASKFLQEAMSVVNSIQNDPYTVGNIREEIRPLYAGILAGQSVSISHPMLRKAADAAGVNYTTFGVGGVR